MSRASRTPIIAAIPKPAAGSVTRPSCDTARGPAIAGRPGGRADRPAGEQVALDLETDPVEDLPLVGVDLEGCEFLVDPGQLGHRVRRVVGDLLEAPLDLLGFGRGRAVHGRRGEAAGDRGTGAGDLCLAARDRDVRLVDEDLDPGTGELLQPFGHERLEVPARDRGEQATGDGEDGRRIARRHGQVCVVERSLEVGDDLVVGAGPDDRRDVRVGPALREGSPLARDTHHGQEHERDRERSGQRIAAQHEANGVHAGRPVGRLQHEQDRDTDDERQRDRRGQHRDAHPQRIDEVRDRHEREEHRSDVGDDHANEQDHPDDGPERDRGQDHLPVLADLPEQERACPPEGGRQDPAGEPAEHAEDRCKDRHAAILGRRPPPACVTARARPIGGVAGGRRKGGPSRLRA